MKWVRIHKAIISENASLTKISSWCCAASAQPIDSQRWRLTQLFKDWRPNILPFAVLFWELIWVSVCVCVTAFIGILFLESFLTKNLRSLFKRLQGFIRGNTPYCHFSLQTFGCEAWYKTSTPLKTDAGLADILESCLPAGTFTGALRSRTLTPFSECSTFYLTMTFWQAILFIVLTTVLCHESSWL